MAKPNYKSITLVLGLIAFSFLFVWYAFAQWTEPSVPPPGGNVDAPINISSTPQNKLGDFGIGGGGGQPIYYLSNLGGTLQFESTSPAGTRLVIGQDGNVGIGTVSPSTKLQVDGGAVWFDGSTGSTPASGEGTRLMWIPAKAAFRVGGVDGSQWNETPIDNIGINSIAMGWNTIASGLYSIAVGTGTEASGPGSTAIGILATAGPGNASTAIGDATTASGGAATAMGNATTASGIASTAMGEGTEASGDGSTAMGGSTTAGGDYSLAIGRGITIDSTGNYSVAIALDNLFTTTISNPNTMAIMGGNVGIGTVSPGAKLDVNGDVIIGAGGVSISSIQRHTFNDWDPPDLADGGTGQYDHTLPSGCFLILGPPPTPTTCGVGYSLVWGRAAAEGGFWDYTPITATNGDGTTTVMVSAINLTGFSCNEPAPTWEYMCIYK